MQTYFKLPFEARVGILLTVLLITLLLAFTGA